MITVDRQSKFRELLNRKPQPGEIVKSKDGRSVPIFFERGAGRPTMFTNAVIDDDCTGWYLSRELTGLKVLLTPRSQVQLIARMGERNLAVQQLRVVRHNRTGTALICELVE